LRVISERDPNRLKDWLALGGALAFWTYLLGRAVIDRL